MISTSEQHLKHPFAGRKRQQKETNLQYVKMNIQRKKKGRGMIALKEKYEKRVNMSKK